MAAVHIGVGHTNDTIVAKFALVVLCVDTASERGYHRLDFLVFENSVQCGFFDVENLTSQRKNGLETSVATLLCASACRVTLDEIYFAVFGVFVGAVGKFAGERGAFERALSSRALARHTRRLSRSLRRNGFKHEFFCFSGVFLKIRSETFRNTLCHRLAHTAVAEFGFCLSFELRFCEFNRDNSRKTFSDVLTAQFFAAFEDSRLGAVIVDNLRQRGFEAVKVRAALFGVDVVCKRQNRVRITVVILHCDFDFAVDVLFVKVNDFGEDGFFGLVHFLNERHYAAVVTEHLSALGLNALVRKFDGKPLVEVCEFAKTSLHRVIVEFERFKDFRVGIEGYRRARVCCVAHYRQRSFRNTAVETNTV